MKKVIITIVAIVLVLGAGAAAYFVLQNNKAQTDVNQSESSFDSNSRQDANAGDANEQRKTGLEALQSRKYDEALTSFKQARSGYESAGNEQAVTDIDNLIKLAEENKKADQGQSSSLPTSGE